MKDRTDHTVALEADLLVRYTQYLEALSYHERISHRIALWRMHRSIDFDDESGMKAGEVGMVPSQRHLPPEMQTNSFQRSQSIP